LKAKRKQYSRAQHFLFVSAAILCHLFFMSCSIAPHIPIVIDDRVERLVRDEAARVVAVTEDRNDLTRYQIFLSDFPRRDILGLSVGQRRIYISYELGRLALRNTRYRWLLRQTIAHEIAHEIAGHAKTNVSFNSATVGRGVTSRDLGLPSNLRFQHYSPEKELQADLEGMKYWEKLNWDCRIWIRILEEFQRQSYSGDIFHPTDQRLKQATRVCPEPGKQESGTEAVSPLSQK
jgi:predicted Zn-dependent protease